MTEERCYVCGKEECECDYCLDCGAQIAPDDCHGCELPYIDEDDE
jgi:hypothetical protein